MLILFLDLALIKLDDPFKGKYIKPLQIEHLWSSQFDGISQFSNSDLVGQKVTISGWGRTETGNYPEVLQKQDVLIRGFENKLVTLTHQVGYGSCRGDSGGRAAKSCCIFIII